MNNALNPAQVIVGSEITEAWDRLEPIIRSFLVKSVAIVSLATAATQLHAQSSGAPSAESAAPVAAHANILSRHRGVSIAIIGVATTLAMRPLDEQITDAVRAPSPQRSVTLRHTADVFNVIGGPGFILASASLLGGGYVSHNATITQLGVRTSEAMIVSSLATRLLKGAFGRQRPFVNEETPNVFAAGRGFTSKGRTSFPSGHASSSFAFASALTFALHARNPKTARYVGPLLYGAATLVGVSRVYGAHHWASDIAAGATVGTLSGWLVTRNDVDIGAGSVRWRF